MMAALVLATQERCWDPGRYFSALATENSHFRRLTGTRPEFGRFSGTPARQVMGILKSAIELLPGGHRLNSWFSYRRRSRKLQKIGDPEARFTHIFRANKWQDAESRSGAGSSLSATVKVRQGLTQLFDDLDVRTVLDAPCGDFNWMQHVISDKPVTYIGSDIVKPLVESNQSSYGDSKTRFLHADITTDELPHADVWICRDCLIHLSFDDIQRVVWNYSRSTVPYWLTTTHYRVRDNVDIPTGHCRMLNLERAPFLFPPPIRYVDDDDLENTGKRLALWSLAQIRELREAKA